MRLNRAIRGLLAAVPLALALATVGAAPAGAVTLTVCETGCDHALLSDAVAAASDGDTIEVAAGTYSEPGGVVIDKGLTIIGAGAGATIIDGGAGAAPQVGQIRIRTDAGEDVSITGLTIAHPVASGGLTIALSVKSIDSPGPAYSFSDLAIEGNGTGEEYGLWSENSTAALTFDAGSISGTAYNPILIEEPRAATTISNSTIARGTVCCGYFSMKPNPNHTGLDTTAPQRVVGNTFTGGATLSFNSDFSQNGSGGYTSIEVSGNTIDAAGITADSAAVALTNRATDDGARARITGAVIAGNRITGDGNGTALRISGRVEGAQITGNDLSGFATGVAVGDSATHGPSGTAVHSNRIVGNGAGITNGAAGGVDAQENWWGCNEGPREAGCDTTTGDVYADPWLTLDLTGPAAVAYPASAAYAASLDQTSAGGPATDASALPGGDVAFAATTGTIDSPAALADGVATTTFAPAAYNGPVTVSATYDNETVLLETAVTDAPLSPTAIVADALLVDTAPTFRLPLGTTRATLVEQGSGAPVAGRVLVFSAGGTALCQATTDASGVASCAASLQGLLGSVLLFGYDVSFAGDANLAASAAVGAGRGPLIRLGGLRLF